MTGFLRSRLRSAIVVGAGLCLVATGVIGFPNDPITEQADRFWDALYIHGAQVEDHESLDALAEASDVIVLGTLASADYGRRRGSDRDGWVHYGHLRVAIHETLRGADLVPSEGLVVEVMLGSDRAFAAMDEVPPGERLVMFLRHKESEARRLGLPDDQVALERGFFRVVQPEAVVRDREGRVHPRMRADNLYGDWYGKPFDDFVAAVRNHLAEASASSTGQ
jgi:hypothetical protein